MNSSSNDPKYNLASIKKCTEALGPYKRMAIWFQGCNIGCPGCCNPELQPFRKNHIISLRELVEIAESSKKEYGIEGVTFIGGEPTLQQSLGTLAGCMKQLDLGVIVFTGRLYEELDMGLIDNVDLVIDGNYDRNRPDYDRNLIGSTNQRIIQVTDRYSNSIQWFTDKHDDYIEIDLYEDGFITNGNAF